MNWNSKFTISISKSMWTNMKKCNIMVIVIKELREYRVILLELNNIEKINIAKTLRRYSRIQGVTKNGIMGCI